MTKRNSLLLNVATGVVSSILMILLKGDFTFEGIMAGILFGLLLTLPIGITVPAIVGRTLKVLAKRLYEATPSPVHTTEIIHQGGAGLFIGRGTVGGKLFLTKKYIVFNSHQFNLKKEKLSIVLSDVRTVSRWTHQRSSIIDNGLAIDTINGVKYKFIVDNRDDWLSVLQQPLADSL